MRWTLKAERDLARTEGFTPAPPLPGVISTPIPAPVGPDIVAMGAIADLAARGRQPAPGGYIPGADHSPEAIRTFDYGALQRAYAGPPPAGMPNPHANHGVFKVGHGPAQQALVTEGQAILRRFDIDPIYGPENLAWAPNVRGQHDIDALRPLVERLRELDARAATTREDVVVVLNRFARDAANRGPAR